MISSSRPQAFASRPHRSRCGREGALPAFTCGTRESESARRPGTGRCRDEICGRRDVGAGQRTLGLVDLHERQLTIVAASSPRRYCFHPGASVCGPGSARLLWFSCPAGPGPPHAYPRAFSRETALQDALVGRRDAGCVGPEPGSDAASPKAFSAQNPLRDASRGPGYRKGDIPIVQI
jgi:hypothetical protein